MDVELNPYLAVKQFLDPSHGTKEAATFSLREPQFADLDRQQAQFTWKVSFELAKMAEQQHENTLSSRDSKTSLHVKFQPKYRNGWDQQILPTRIVVYGK